MTGGLSCTMVACSRGPDREDGSKNHEQENSEGGRKPGGWSKPPFPLSLYFALFSSLLFIFRLSPLSERLEQPVTMATVTGERQLRNDRVVVTTDLHARNAF